MYTGKLAWVAKGYFAPCFKILWDLPRPTSYGLMRYFFQMGKQEFCILMGASLSVKLLIRQNGSVFILG